MPHPQMNNPSYLLRTFLRVQYFNLDEIIFEIFSDSDQMPSNFAFFRNNLSIETYFINFEFTE